MRSLKKVLALVLALVLVFGVMSVAGATSFTDDPAIKNTEAVEVLSALRIVEGYPDGSFGPEKNITRAEMAAIVARIMLGRQLADTLRGSSTQFTDVPASHWASGYVAYCSSEEIINGRGDGTFDPSGNVTVGEAAKMLLLAAGIKGEYTGANWLVNVTTAAVRAGIIGADADVRAAATRDEIAGAAFNAMQIGTPVTTTSTKYITNGGVYDTWAECQAAINGGETYIGTATVTETQIRDSLLDNQGVTKQATTDIYGRPAANYVKAGKVLVTIPVAADLTYTTAVTGGKIYTDLGKPSGATYEIYCEGDYGYDDFQYGPSGDAFAIVSGNDAYYGGNGTVVEVYYNAQTKLATIVEIYTYLGMITGHTDAVKDANGDIVTPEYITIEDLDGYWYPFDFATTAYSDKDVNETLVLFSIGMEDGNFVAADVVAPETVKASATRINTGAGTFVAGGKTYGYSQYWVTSVTAAYVTAGTELNIVLDRYGYVLAADPAGAGVTAANYAVVERVGATVDEWGTPTYIAMLRFPDGKAERVTTVDAAGNPQLVAAGIIASYEVTRNGAYVLNYIDDVYNFDAVNVTRNRVQLTYTSGTNTYPLIKANARTVFMVQSGPAANPAYNSYTGIGAVPTLTAASAAYVDGDGDGFAEVVYLYSGELAPTGTTTTDVVIIGALVDTTVDAQLGTYYTYSAVVNNEITTVDSSVTLSSGFYSALTRDNNGLVYAAAPMSTAVYGTGIGKAASGVISVAGDDLTYDTNTTVYRMNGATGAFTRITITQVVEDTSVPVGYILTADGVLRTLLIIV